MNHQDLEISHLKTKVQVRDQQLADLQAKWNFHSFKYQLLIDMVRSSQSFLLAVICYALSACAHHIQALQPHAIAK